LLIKITIYYLLFNLLEYTVQSVYFMKCGLRFKQSATFI